MAEPHCQLLRSIVSFSAPSRPPALSGACTLSLTTPSPSCFRHRPSHRATFTTSAPELSSAFPTPMPYSPKETMISARRTTSCKCNCNMFSEAKEFIKDKLGLSEEDDDEEEELSQGSPQTTVKVPKEREGNQASMGRISQKWRELQGSNHWEGLLDPLDLDLRRTILFYGDFNQAVYDSFETDEHSKYTGACRFSKEDFFEGVRLVNGREIQYDVVRYLYATSVSVDVHGLVFMRSYSREAWSKESNWIGYVAVSNDEATKFLGRRDIVIVWRGTMRPFEWLNDFDFRQADITPLQPASSSTKTKKDDDDDSDGGDEPSVEKGWLTIYTSSSDRSAFTTSSARDQILNEVRTLLKKYDNEVVSITILGHSLGAALAVVNAFDIAINKINVREGKETCLVTALVFGCPSVGDEAFVKKCEELDGLRVLRVRNKIDLITKYPGWLMGYRDVGKQLLFSSLDSPYLKKSNAPGDWHNLEVHLHMVAGTQGVGNDFKFTINRNVALINKSSEALRDDFLVPGSWWQMQYKGLVQREDGSWFMPDREEGKRPKPEPLNDLNPAPSNN
ncbi:hypothetical protein GOP47_0019185 [Adiantum capillus-veneris]|uniref:Phospholipase A1 n=1 Tax=Adiantum capillus-veneris TaxID=13818 RepID=A0A9D4UEN5_ADICA|nr:hypothetical protein GOP47_0019185 [Adiantum capillus-veneris]